jgi:hypothetical protein
MKNRSGLHFLINLNLMGHLTHYLVITLPDTLPDTLSDKLSDA